MPLIDGLAVAGAAEREACASDCEQPLCEEDAEVRTRRDAARRGTAAAGAAVVAAALLVVSLRLLQGSGRRVDDVGDVSGEVLEDKFSTLPSSFESTTDLPYNIRTLSNDPLCVQYGPVGQRVVMKACGEVNPEQQWRLNPENGHIVEESTARCLSHGSGAEGRVYVDNCTDGSPDLEWRYTDHDLTDAKGQCLSWKGEDYPQMRDCSESAETERVVLKPIQRTAVKYKELRWPSGPRHLRSPSGQCVQYQGVAAALAPCSAMSPQQHWVYFASTQQIMSFWHRRCLRAARAGNPRLGVLTVEACDSEAAGQRWFRNHKRHHISNEGLCIQAAGSMLERCDPRKPAQTFKLVRVAGWPEHGGVVKANPFVGPKAIPQGQPEGLKHCHPGAKRYTRCGAEKLHKGTGIPYKKMQELQYLIWKKSFPYRVVVHAGDHRGLWFRYGKKYEDKPVQLASELKPMTAVLAMRLIELGALGLDDKVNKWLDWWPKATADSRSYITLRHCLSFTSGFYGMRATRLDGTPHEYYPFDANREPFDWFELPCKDVDPTACAKAVLHQVPHLAPPGVIWTYTEDHLRIAVAVMVAVTGKHLGALLEEHVFSRTVPPMRKTRPYYKTKYWNPGSNAISSARDYQRFIDSYFRGRLLSNHSAHEMESDQQLHTQVRYFMGAGTVGRPAGHGIFGLGFWRSHSVRTMCGVWGWCSYAPSYFLSTAVSERMWPYFIGQKKCPWKHSSTCSFYFHFQNANRMSVGTAQAKFRGFSRAIEMKVHSMLSGGQEVPGSMAA